MRGQDERVRLPELDLVFREEPLIPHQAQHDVAAPHRALGVRARVVERGRLGERGQGRGFRDVQLPRRLPEVDLGRGLDPVRARAQVDLVQVELEDRVLGEIALDLHRDAGFLELARELLLPADLIGKDVAGQLHTDRREALRIAERQQIRLERAQDAPVVDAVMGVKPLVLGGDERLPQRHRNGGERKHGAALQPELADEPAVGSEQLGGLHLHVVAGREQARDAGAVLARADAGPRAVGEPHEVRHRQGRDRDQTSADLGVVPPGGGARQGNRRGDRSHRVTT